MAQSWLDNSEIVAGLVLQGRMPITHVRPEIFMSPYDEMIKLMQDGTEKEDLVLKVGSNTLNTALDAAKSLNGLGEKADWSKVLELSYVQHTVGTKLERFGKKFQRGDTISAAEIIELASKIDRDEGDLMPLSDIKPQAIPFIKIGYEPIDRILGGIPKVGLVTVGAPPKVGKTSLAVAWAGCFVQKYEDKQVAFFSLEMLKSELSQRFIDINPTLTREQKSRIIVCDDMVTPGELANKAARIPNLGLIIIDFADLLVPGEVTEPEMTVVYKTLASLAKRLEVPIILLAQLSGGYQGGIPRPHHLRYTRLAEALSWMVLMLYAPTRETFSSMDGNGSKKKYDWKEPALPVTQGRAYIICWMSRGGFRGKNMPGPLAIETNWLGNGRGWGVKNPKYHSLIKGAVGDDDDEEEE